MGSGIYTLMETGEASREATGGIMLILTEGCEQFVGLINKF